MTKECTGYFISTNETKLTRNKKLNLIGTHFFTQKVSDNRK